MAVYVRHCVNFFDVGDTGNSLPVYEAQEVAEILLWIRQEVAFTFFVAPSCPSDTGNELPLSPKFT